MKQLTMSPDMAIKAKGYGIIYNEVSGLVEFPNSNSAYEFAMKYRHNDNIKIAKACIDYLQNYDALENKLAENDNPFSVDVAEHLALNDAFLIIVLKYIDNAIVEPVEVADIASENWYVNKSEDEPNTAIFMNGCEWVIGEMYGEDTTEAEARAQLASLAPDMLRVLIRFRDEYVVGGTPTQRAVNYGIELEISEIINKLKK